MGLSMGGKNASALAGSEPLQKQKADIVDTLLKMNSNMRDYTLDVEARLEKAHLAMGGGVKRYGFENMGAKNMDEFLENDRLTGGLDSKAYDRNLNRMAKHATQFLKQTSEQPSAAVLPKIDSSRMPKIAGRVPSGRQMMGSTEDLMKQLKQGGGSVRGISGTKRLSGLNMLP